MKLGPPGLALRAGYAGFKKSKIERQRQVLDIEYLYLNLIFPKAQPPEGGAAMDGCVSEKHAPGWPTTKLHMKKVTHE